VLSEKLINDKKNNEHAIKIIKLNKKLFFIYK